MSDTLEEWYKVCRSEEITNKPFAKNIKGIPIVLFRGENNKVGALLDRCPHRNIPMSKGWVENETLVCRYHGWHFNTEGVCVKVSAMKNQEYCQARNAYLFQTEEKDGFIYINCIENKKQFPQIKAKPKEVQYRIPQINDPNFLRFFINLAIVIILIGIVIYTWFKFVPYFLLR